jgi:outer membrane lipoprotein-sorting protein
MPSTFAIVGLLLTMWLPAAADDPRQIVDEAQKKTTVASERYAGLLQTTDANGKTSEKQWMLEKLGSHGQSKTVIRFTAPADVKGVALLIVNHPDRDSDQWMYTPAIERERRIAVQDRATRFFGTDFSFEDLEERDIDQYDYALLGEEAIDGALCWKIQSTPKSSKASQYTRAILWVRKDNYATARIDSLIKDQVVRRLTNGNLSNIQGVWTARDVTMVDVRRGSRTRLLLDKIEFNVRLPEENFTISAIRRR